MKTKFLFAALAATLTLGVLSPTIARAHDSHGGYYVTRVVGYDSCGRPVYRQVWVPSSHSHGHGHSHGHNPFPSGHGHGCWNPGHGGGFSVQLPGFNLQFGSSGHHGHGHSHGH